VLSFVAPGNASWHHVGNLDLAVVGQVGDKKNIPEDKESTKSANLGMVIGNNQYDQYDQYDQYIPI